MDFDLNDEQKLLRDTTRELLDRSYDLEQLTAAQETPRGWRDDVWRRLDRGPVSSDWDSTRTTAVRAPVRWRSGSS